MSIPFQISPANKYNPATDFPRIPELILSNSSLNTFRSCPRKLEFRKFYENNNYDTSVPGDAGNALHRGWQSFLTHHDKDRAIWEFMCNFPIEQEPKYGWSIHWCLGALNRLLDEDALLQYQLAEIIDVNGVIHPAVEVPFRITFKNLKLPYDTKVSYIGYIDAILFDIFKQTYIVVDLKNHRDNGKISHRVAKYCYDDQCIPYSMVLERMLGHEIESFEIKYIDCFVDLTETQVSVLPFYKTKADVVDFLHGFLDDIDKIGKYYARGWFPRKGGNACYNFKRKCGFYDVCEYRKPVEVRQWMKNNNVNMEGIKHNIWVELELDLEIAA